MFGATLDHSHFIKMARIVIFPLCLQAYPDQALLLLVTGALGLRMEHSALRPVLPVLNTFKVTCSPISPHTDIPDYQSVCLENKMRMISGDVSVLQENLWALKWLLDMSFTADHLRSVLQEVTQEMENTEGVCASSRSESNPQLLHQGWSNEQVYINRKILYISHPAVNVLCS